MSFAWHLIWRSVTRPEAARAEERLLDLGPARWRRGDVSVSSAPGDAVHAVSVDGGGPRAGTALVMVHGLGTGSGIFFKNVGPLAASFGALHSVDWRGAGLSGRPAFPGDQPHDLARDFLVDGLNEWTRQHGVEKMVLLGHSMGGLVAAHFADRYPERVEHLVLVGPAGVGARRSRFQKGDSWAYDLAEKFWLDGYTPAGVIRALGPWGKRSVEGYAARRFGRALSDAEVAALAEYIHSVNSLPGSSERVMNQLLGPIAQPKVPIGPIVEKLPMPVTYIYGESDWMNPSSGAASAKKCIDGKCYVLPGGGHYIFLDQPALFNKTLLGRVRP